MCVITSGIIAGVSAYRSANAQADALEAQSQQEMFSQAMSNISSQVAQQNVEIAKQNAENARIMAGQAIEAGEIEAQDKSREARQERGSGIAKAAGQGVMIEGRKESVSTMYEADQKAELAYDQAKIMQNAEMRAWGYLSEAQRHEMEAASHGMEAISQQYAGMSHGIAASSLQSQASSTRSLAPWNAALTGFGTSLSTASGIVGTAAGVKTLMS